MTSAISSTGPSAFRPNILRFAATGAIASGIFFLLCWAGALLSVGAASHMYIQLFTRAEISSLAALAEGLCWSILFGAIAGALIAGTYRLITPAARD
ncbi:hypothetical protein OF829_14350 [Sphingomonas sp. LB-2]|uniref:hypothetical protein n=1 Tax=Sphingomonas caeni TaxID=2984949 RepID=UPI00222FF536|nr:hypothetical protein [Sphingomonas caeni]MCW3848421.1 hypothetical protein [Sphingomonas caeni]